MSEKQCGAALPRVNCPGSYVKSIFPDNPVLSVYNCNFFYTSTPYSLYPYRSTAGSDVATIIGAVVVTFTVVLFLTSCIVCARAHCCTVHQQPSPPALANTCSYPRAPTITVDTIDQSAPRMTAGTAPIEIQLKPFLDAPPSYDTVVTTQQVPRTN